VEAGGGLVHGAATHGGGSSARPTRGERGGEGRSGGPMATDPHHTCGGVEEHEFSGLALQPVTMVYQWFNLKTTTIVSCFGTINQE
jgi:hypothetical protein